MVEVVTIDGVTINHFLNKRKEKRKNLVVRLKGYVQDLKNPNRI